MRHTVSVNNHAEGANIPRAASLTNAENIMSNAMFQFIFCCTCGVPSSVARGITFNSMTGGLVSRDGMFCMALVGSGCDIAIGVFVAAASAVCVARCWGSRRWVTSHVTKQGQNIESDLVSHGACLTKKLAIICNVLMSRKKRTSHFYHGIISDDNHRGTVECLLASAVQGNCNVHSTIHSCNFFFLQKHRTCDKLGKNCFVHICDRYSKCPMFLFHGRSIYILPQ